MSRLPVRTAPGLFLLAVIFIAAPTLADRVELRGTAAPIDGTVESITPAGVAITSRRSGLEQKQTVAWSSIRSVTGGSATDSERTKWLAAGEDLWRGRIRLARGDWGLALAPLERAFRAWNGAIPTVDGLAASVACAEALRRAGRSTEAVQPAFEAIRISRAGVSLATDADSRLQDAAAQFIDPRVPLPPSLPSVAFDERSAATIRTALKDVPTGADISLLAVIASYSASLSGPPVETAPTVSAKIESSAKTASSALQAIAECQSADPKLRAAALGSLARLRKSMPPWFEPWARCATAIALAADGDPSLHERGLVLLASLQAEDRNVPPILLARAAAESQSLASLRSGASSIVTFIGTPSARPDTAVPKESSDQTASWLEANGRADLLVAHLEGQIESEPEGEGRSKLVDRLAGIMASRLEREDDESKRDALMAQAMSLVKRFDAGSEPLRLVIMRAQHRAAQRTAEDRRAGRGSDQECESARQQLESLIRDLTTLSVRALKAKTEANRNASLQVGIAAEQLVALANRNEEIARSAQFFRAWASYYSAWLGRELGYPDWRSRADDALRWFADLIEPGRVAIEPSEISLDLRSSDGFASSLLGTALAASLAQTGATADAWIALLEVPQTHGSVRLKLPAWKMASYLDRNDLAAALKLLQSEGDGPQGIPMALIAAARAGRQPDAAGSAELLTESVGRLVAAGKLKELSVITLAPGMAPAGPGAQLFAAVRSAAEANRLKEAGQSAESAKIWQRATEEIAGAFTADSPAAVSKGARALNGYILRGAGRFEEASAAFLAASREMQSERAGDARWMAVLSLDEFLRRSKVSSNDARLNALVDGVITDLPETAAAVRARAWRVLHTETPTVLDIDALLGDQVPVELAPAARHAGLDGLYRRFRTLAGDDRRVAARRALAAGDDVAAGGGDEGTLELRRRLEMAIALDDRMRAADALLLLDPRVAASSDAKQLAPELTARRAQIAALDGRLDDARREVSALDPSSAWGRVAAQSLLDAVMRNPSCGPEVRATVARAVVAGQLVPGATETAMWMRAEAELLRSKSPAVDAAAVSTAAATALKNSPRSSLLLLADADLRSAKGDLPGAALQLRTVLAAAQPGSEPWLEAKAMQIEAMAVTDPLRARTVLEQTRQLVGGFGAGEGALRLTALDAQLPREVGSPSGGMR